MLHPFILAGVGIASVKDSVKAALGQKAAITQGTSGLDLSAEARVQFWVRPGLKDPTVQERLQHAWAAVLSPTGDNTTLHAGFCPTVWMQV